MEKNLIQRNNESGHAAISDLTYSLVLFQRTVVAREETDYSINIVISSEKQK